MPDLMRRPRKLNQLFAWWRGYFWLSCDRCGVMYGGHETGEGHDIYDRMYSSGNVLIAERSKTVCWRHNDDRDVAWLTVTHQTTGPHA